MEQTTITDATTEAKTESQASSADSTTVLTCEPFPPSSPLPRIASFQVLLHAQSEHDTTIPYCRNTD